MTIELILWLAAIAGMFYIIMFTLNQIENKRIRKRRKADEELKSKVVENLCKDNGNTAINPKKIKAETLGELKNEVGKKELIHPPKVTESVMSDGETLYETEPPWAKAMRESAEQESKAEIKKEYVLGPNERVIDVNGHTVVETKPKSVEDRVRELLQKKQNSKPFYKDHNKEDWE